MGATRIKLQIGLEVFKDWRGSREMKIGPHARFRLDDPQRNLFIDNKLILAMKREVPVLVGLQENGRYTAFFRLNGNYRRIIFELAEDLIEITTFYDVDNLPDLKDGKQKT